MEGNNTKRGMLLQVMVDQMRTMTVSLITVVKVATVNRKRNVIMKGDTKEMMIQTTPTNAPYR